MTMITTLLGNKYDKLTVISFSHEKQRYKKNKLIPSKTQKSGHIYYWKCMCTCGKECVVEQNALKKGDIHSCGHDAVATNKIQDRATAIKKRIYTRYKCRLKGLSKEDGSRRNLEFKLTFKQFSALISKPCHYCGAVSSNKYPDRYDKTIIYECNGVDRVDSNVGYVSSNCVPCCSACNSAKLDMPIDEFAEWIIEIKNHFIDSGKFDQMKANK